MAWAEAVEEKVTLQNGIIPALSLWSCECSLRGVTGADSRVEDTGNLQASFAALVDRGGNYCSDLTCFSSLFWSTHFTFGTSETFVGGELGLLSISLSWAGETRGTEGQVAVQGSGEPLSPQG